MYTPSEYARAALLHLQEIGMLRALQGHTSSRENLASFLFFTVVSGSGELEYGGKRHELRTGDCVFIDCRKPYAHTTGEDLWTLRWVHFDGPTMPFVYQKYCQRGGQPVFRPEDVSGFLAVLDALYALAGGTDYIRDMRINEELNRLTTLLMEQSWHPEEARMLTKKASAAEVREYLDRHYAEKITLDELAAQFFINKYYLTRVFKEQYGISALEEIAYVNGFIDRERLTEAAKAYGKSPYGEHLKAVAEGRVRY